jgi:hypothetical protein
MTVRLAKCQAVQKVPVSKQGDQMSFFCKNGPKYSPNPLIFKINGLLFSAGKNVYSKPVLLLQFFKKLPEANNHPIGASTGCRGGAGNLINPVSKGNRGN